MAAAPADGRETSNDVVGRGGGGTVRGPARPIPRRPGPVRPGRVRRAGRRRAADTMVRPRPVGARRRAGRRVGGPAQRRHRGAGDEAVRDRAVPQVGLPGRAPLVLAGGAPLPADRRRYGRLRLSDNALHHNTFSPDRVMLLEP